MTETVAVVARRRRFSPVWIIPLAALVVGLWLLAQSLINQGPRVEISFATAEGLVAGETPVKMLSVDLGLVEEVVLNEDFSGVTAIARLVPAAADLLRTDTQFWVVRPRIGTSGISGLSTILSGAYIELAPGPNESGQSNGSRSYRGLDDVPITPQGTPGLHIELVSPSASSISVGTAIFYNGYRVGRIESSKLDTADGIAHYQGFIDAPYDDLVTHTTRFWNASGISISAGVSGVNINTESLESIFTGGIAFGLPDGAETGNSVKDGSKFRLYPDIETVNKNPFEHSQDYILLFDSSIRGLAVDAPVEYRGMRIGSVISAPYNYAEDGKLWTKQDAREIPVLVRIHPGWLGSDSNDAVSAISTTLEQGIPDGLRASLAIGNLLTGGLYVDFDFYPGSTTAKLSAYNKMPQFPTVASGFDQIEQKVASLLTKLQSLPLDQTVDAATSAISQVEKTVATADSTLAGLNSLLDTQGVQNLPEAVEKVLVDAREVLQGLGPGSPINSELVQALTQLRYTLTGAQSVLENYDAKPNALIFPMRRGADPVPNSKKGED